MVVLFSCYMGKNTIGLFLFDLFLSFHFYDIAVSIVHC